MIVGVPRETKDGEHRVALVPESVRALSAAGHTLLVEHRAGEAISLGDAAFATAGAELVPADDVWARAELVVKVKELQRSERARPRSGQMLFCFQHLGPEPELLDAVLARGVTCLAYETVSDATGALPILAPMSKIAGRLAPQVGAWALQMNNGGSGVLLGGLPGDGVPPGNVVVAGAGAVGAQAAAVAAGLGARVTVFARTPARLGAIEQLSGGRIETAVYEPQRFAAAVQDADLVVGAVLVPGRLSPKLISRALLHAMRPRSVLVEVGIDQGGIAESARPTTLSAPLYMEEDIVHCCVPNLPAMVARSASFALAQAVLPYTLALANRGLAGALAADPGLAAGLQVHAGGITDARLAEDTGRTHAPYRP